MTATPMFNTIIVSYFFITNRTSIRVAHYTWYVFIFFSMQWINHPASLCRLCLNEGKESGFAWWCELKVNGAGPRISKCV